MEIAKGEGRICWSQSVWADQIIWHYKYHTLHACALEICAYSLQIHLELLVSCCSSLPFCSHNNHKAMICQFLKHPFSLLKTRSSSTTILLSYILESNENFWPRPRFFFASSIALVEEIFFFFSDTVPKEMPSMCYFPSWWLTQCSSTSLLCTRRCDEM